MCGGPSLMNLSGEKHVRTRIRCWGRSELMVKLPSRQKCSQFHKYKPSLDPMNAMIFHMKIVEWDESKRKILQ